jgi:hypothetical protein
MTMADPETRTEAPASTSCEDETAARRVPPEAENFEHVLRRLAARRAAERAAKPGLYR